MRGYLSEIRQTIYRVVKADADRKIINHEISVIIIEAKTSTPLLKNSVLACCENYYAITIFRNSKRVIENLEKF